MMSLREQRRRRADQQLLLLLRAPYYAFYLAYNYHSLSVCCCCCLALCGGASFPCLSPIWVGGARAAPAQRLPSIPPSFLASTVSHHDRRCPTFL